MEEFYLKNSTGVTKEVADLGIVIDDGQSISIDVNDIDGYLTDDMVAALSDNPALGLILSTTPIGDTSGDFPKAIAIERLTLKTKWKPSVVAFANLPAVGNENGDVRLTRDTGVFYVWNAGTATWGMTTSTFDLKVTEYDESPLGSNIAKLVFVQAEDNVYIDDNTHTAYIGPPTPPTSLTGLNLSISGTTTYSGGLSQDNVNYKTGALAGAVVSYIINDAIFSLSTPNSSTACDYADVGTLKVYLNDAVIATADLGANFQEINRDSNQVMNNYDNVGTGDPMTNGVVTFVGGAAGKGNLTITFVGKHNSFKYYQRWNATVNITDSTLLRQGWNSIYLKREGLSSSQQSSTLDLFYDTDTGSNPSVSTPSVTEAVPVFKYLSGVKYYDVGSTWDVDVTGSDCFDNVYHSTGSPIELYGWPGLATTAISYQNSSVTGVSTPPRISESMSVSNWPLTQSLSQMSSDARITARARDPYGNYTAVQSVSQNILIWSYADSSTDLIEHFRDEKYRLLNTAHDTIPSPITAQWDSTESLDSYDDGAGLQLYLDELYFPTINFSTYMPTGNPNYSLIASETNKVYVRAFKDSTTSHASGTLRITGITKAQLYARDIRVYIKAPTQTGWLDLTRDYNFASFTAIDDDGCWVNRSSQSTSDFQFTLGTKYTENSGWMIIVKVVYPSSAVSRISYMGITDW